VERALCRALSERAQERPLHPKAEHDDEGENDDNSINEDKILVSTHIIA
jgi:hypothetical protein